MSHITLLSSFALGLGLGFAIHKYANFKKSDASTNTETTPVSLKYEDCIKHNDINHLMKVIKKLEYELEQMNESNAYLLWLLDHFHKK